MIHLDIKKLGRFDRIGRCITGDCTGRCNRRGIGWGSFLSASSLPRRKAGDASRLAFSQIVPDERAESAAAFLRATVAYYPSLGITVARVMTDNGPCYKLSRFATPAATRPPAHQNQALHAASQR